MAAIQWDLNRWEREQEQRPRERPAAPPLRIVTAPPSRRRPSAAAYRRRRLVALALLVALVVTTVLVASRWATAGASAGAAPAAPVAPVVAQPGDSYWTLADRLDLGGDLRSVVDQLVAANGGAELQPGDRIVLSP
jgi:hypothetical protein